MRPLCRIVVNYVDMAASIAQDEADLMEDFTAVVLIVSTAIMLRASSYRNSARSLRPSVDALRLAPMVMS
jgi:hypothetical protein